jgi:hypothetical protein
MVGLIASGNASDGADSAVLTLYEFVAAGTDLAARIVSIQGAPQALSQAALHSRDIQVAKSAAAVLGDGAFAGHASTIANPDVLAALVSASGRAGMDEACVAALANCTAAFRPLALRVADTPGAEAAALAALTSGDLRTARFAASLLWNISRADAKRIMRLLSVPEVQAALARLLLSTDGIVVEVCTCEVHKAVCSLLACFGLKWR